MTKSRKGIAVIIKNKDGEVLLMQRGFAARSEHGHWENPGGEIEVDENSKEAAVREIKEELGVDVEITKLLYSDEFPLSSEETIWTIDVFEGIIYAEPRIQEPDKCSDIKWFSLDKLASLPLASYTRADFKKLGWLDN